MYDIVFISYKEPNAAENYAALKERFPMTKPVDGVKGIHQAHIAAAKKCFTKMYWIVDGDAQVLDSFNFDYEVPDHQLDHVHVWRSKNPINGLEYGYGGVKLFPRRMTINMDTSKPDMTTSISDNFRVMNEISNITAFNTDPFNTWKSAFRECAKLSSKSIQGQLNIETEDRLAAWLNPISDALYRNEAKRGAQEGREYGEKHAQSPQDLRRINDFDWLYEQFSNNTLG